MARKEKSIQDFTSEELLRIKPDIFSTECGEKLSNLQEDMKRQRISMYFHISINSKKLDRKAYKEYPKLWKEFSRGNEYSLTEYESLMNEAASVIDKDLHINACIEDNRSSDMYFLKFLLVKGFDYDLLKILGHELPEFPNLNNTRQILYDLNNQYDVEVNYLTDQMKIKELLKNEKPLTKQEQKERQKKLLEEEKRKKEERKQAIKEDLELSKRIRERHNKRD